MDIEKLKSYNLKNKNGELTDKKIKRARFRLLEPLSQRYNIVVHISGSSARTDVFRKLAGRLILINNRIRWNGWYNILLILLTLKGKVEEYYEKYKNKFEENFLFRKDWKKLNIIKDFLTPFLRVILVIKRDFIFIDRTLFNIDILIKHL